MSKINYNEINSIIDKVISSLEVLKTGTTSMTSDEITRAAFISKHLHYLSLDLNNGSNMINKQLEGVMKNEKAKRVKIN